jgi:hypothetical protein
MNTALLSQLEAAEHAANSALARVSPHSRHAVQLRELLNRARTAKASLLAGQPDILRKSARQPIKLGVGGPRERQAQDTAAVEMLKAMFRSAVTLPQVGTDGALISMFLQARAGR